MSKINPKSPNNYFGKFQSIFAACMASGGYTTNEARDFAELELTGKLFHEPQYGEEPVSNLRELTLLDQ